MTKLVKRDNSFNMSAIMRDAHAFARNHVKKFPVRAYSVALAYGLRMAWAEATSIAYARRATWSAKQSEAVIIQCRTNNLTARDHTRLSELRAA